MRRHSGLPGHFLLTHGIVDQKSPNFAPWALLGASGVIVYGEAGWYNVRDEETTNRGTTCSQLSG